MRKIFLFLIFILLGKLLFSQQYLNKTFTINGVSYPPTTIIPTDSGYLCSSFSAINIYLLDSSAGTKWHKQYSMLWPGGIGLLNKTIGGKYYSAGTLQLGGLYDKPFFIMLNNEFDTLFTKVLITDSTAIRTPLIVNSLRNTNGDFILIGSDQQDSSGNIFSGNYGNGLLLMVDSTGIIKTHKTLGSTVGNDWLNTGFQMGNYYYLFGGSTSFSPISVIGFDRVDGWIVKTDLFGNEVANSSFGNLNLYDHDFIFAFKTPENKLLTGVDYGIAEHSSGFRMFKPRLFVLNDDLSIYKDIFLKNSYVSNDTLNNCSFVDGILNIDTTYTFLGRDVAVSISNHNGLYSNGFILKLNKEYKVLFFRNYIHNGGVFTSIVPTVITSTVDSGYVFGGYVNDNTLTPTQQAWLVKTDSLGCDGFHSCDDTTLVCQILNAPDTACKNDTAWLQVKFKGRSAPYFVYANTILALDSVYYPYTLPLWIDTLVPYYPTTTGMQQVIIKVNDPWGWQQSDTVNIFVKNCGTGNIEQSWYPKKVEIYPNPVTIELHLKIRSVIIAPVNITIYDMQGKIVKQITTKLNENVIDVSEFVQGVYGVNVMGNNINVNERIVKL